MIGIKLKGVGANTFGTVRQRMSALASIVPLGYDEAFTPVELLKLHPELNGKILMVNKRGVSSKGDNVVFSHPSGTNIETTKDSNGTLVNHKNLYISCWEGDVFNGHPPAISGLCTTGNHRVACLLENKLICNGITQTTWDTFRDFTLMKGTIKGSAEALISAGYTLYPIENYNWIKMPMVLPPDYAGSYTPPPGLIDLCDKDECCLDVIYVANELPSFMGGGFAKTRSLRYYYEEWLSKRSVSAPSLVVSDLLTC